jgi:ethylene-insensitive protein 2
LLKLEGSDWLFRFESGFDEDLIATVAMREKVLLNADAKNHYMMQSTNEQFLGSVSKQLAKSEFDPALSASSVPCCGEHCVWKMELVISFGVWCMHRILELALMESRPELWGKYTYVLNRLQV